MKNLVVLFFLFFTTQLVGQSNFSVNLIGNVDYSFSKYSYNNGTIDEELNFKMPLGKSFDLQLEYKLNSKVSVLTGLSYSERRINPRLLLPPAYGTQFKLDSDSTVVYLSTPYLASHKIKTLSLPISIRYYNSLSEKVSLFADIGGLVSFRISESEIYKTSNEWDMENLENQDIENHFEYSNNEIGLFNTAVILGGGLSYKIQPRLNVVFQARASVLEYRKGNEKFKKNGDMLWKDQFLPIGNLSLGLGLQKAF